MIDRKLRVVAAGHRSDDARGRRYPRAQAFKARYKPVRIPEVTRHIMIVCWRDNAHPKRIGICCDAAYERMPGVTVRINQTRDDKLTAAIDDLFA